MDTTTNKMKIGDSVRVDFECGRPYVGIIASFDMSGWIYLDSGDAISPNNRDLVKVTSAGPEIDPTTLGFDSLLGLTYASVRS